MRIWGLAVVAVLGLAAVGRPAPLDLKQVPAQATWFIHVDADALRACEVGKASHAHFHQFGDFAKIGEHLGMDLKKDLHGVTLYGSKIGSRMGIAMVHANVNQELLLAKVKKVPDYKSSTYGSYELHGWTVQKGRLRGLPMNGAFWKPTVMVLGQSAEDVKLALDVLDGKAPSLAGKTSPLTAAVPPGAVLVARAAGLADAKLPEKAPLGGKMALPVKDMENLGLVVGEYQGEAFFAGKAAMKSAENAALMKQVVEGFRALGELQHADDADALRLIRRVNVSATDKTVDVEFRAPAADVAAEVKKCVKAAAEKRRAKKGDGPKPSDDKK